MKFRTLNKWYANLNGYFWEPCPLCSKEFGGHEWKDRNGLSSVIPHPNGRKGSGQGICPDCTRAGRGIDRWDLLK